MELLQGKRRFSPLQRDADVNNATNATETTDLRPEASTGIEAWAGSQNHATRRSCTRVFFTSQWPPFWFGPPRRTFCLGRSSNCTGSVKPSTGSPQNSSARRKISPDASDSHMEYGDFSPLCLSNTAFLSIGVGRQQTFHFNFR